MSDTFNGRPTVSFIEDAAVLTNEELMDKYDRSARTIRRWRQLAREDEPRTMELGFPEAAGPIYDGFLRLDHDAVTILTDIEIPEQDAEILDMAVRLSNRLGIENLIIGGDLIAVDAFSTWPVIHKQPIDFESDLDIAMRILKMFTSNFDSVTYLMGNHERRLARQTRGQINIGMLCKHILGLRCSEYSYCELRSGDQEILIAHPKEYSRVPLSVPLRLAAVYHKNICVGHTHRLAVSYDPSGKYWVAETGFCRSEKHTLYKQMEMASNPAWNLGWGIIINGQFYPIHKGNFDFWMTRVRPVSRWG